MTCLLFQKTLGVCPSFFGGKGYVKHVFMGLGKALGRSLVFKRQSKARSTQKMLRLFFSDSLCFHGHHLPTKWSKKV